jgi:DeoR/GlpR family transcriptional regulator of sugar metabolism
VLDNESHYHVAHLDSIDTLVTDSGIWASQRLEFSQMGIEVLVAGEVEDHD